MRSTRPLARLALVALCALPACQGASTPEPAADLPSQLDHGAKAYGARCARCHGDAGQGTEKAPLLVGKGALPLDPRPGQKRTQPFHTALDVAAFATKNMPPDEDVRAEIPEADYWAVLAFALKANGVALNGPVDASSAAKIVLHP